MCIQNKQEGVVREILTTLFLSGKNIFPFSLRTFYIDFSLYSIYILLFYRILFFAVRDMKSLRKEKTKYSSKREEEKIMKRFIVALMVMAMTATAMVGCGSDNTANSGSNADAGTENTADAGNEEDTEGAGVSGGITVISREDGSGTRGAFIELFGVEEKDADGNKTDKTTVEAVIANSTEIVLSNVAGDPNAIGYVSLGSLSDEVKAVKIEGAEATVENIKNGTYKISRPFNIATNGTPNDAAQDFINFILSAEGQAVVEDAGYIASVDDAQAFESTGVSGKVVVAGSSSVTPVMEKLKEAYEKVNPDVEIEINQSDSTTGIQAAMDGTADIGMASRELKDSESSLTSTVIAIDGIAVIVNNENTVDDMTADEVKAIFTGETTTW